MDSDKEFSDRQVARLRQAGIPDDQINLALKTSENLLRQVEVAASAHDDEPLSLGEVMAAIVSSPPGKPRP